MPATSAVPPLQSLHTLEVLSRHRRIGAAAAELGLSHAAVSQTVSRLEKRFSVQLFHKNSWGVEATQECRDLVEAYLSASSTLQRALNDVKRGRRLRVLLPKMAWFWLSPAITRLCRSTPDISFRAYQDDDVVDLDGSDLAIVASGHVPPAGYAGAALFDERLIPVCSPAFAAQTRIETPASLARTPLLISGRDLWLAWFARAGLVSDPSVAGPMFADSTLAVEAAVRGQGVALCCTLAAAGAVSRGELVSPIRISAETGRRFWAVWKGAQSPPAMRILDWLLAELEAGRTDHVTPVEAPASPNLASERVYQASDRETGDYAWSRFSKPIPEISNAYS
ncbi:MAG TPA: LysR substrate-binding domain-containing protein [Caulobacteraceae bacterium]|jgi:DNA-binding transcriptional LysR family regulator|nr:LysR substrate-binding domain-containing protein [Caulobacteraceae bacterium]